MCNNLDQAFRGHNCCKFRGLKVLDLAWRLVYVGIKKKPTLSGLIILWMVDFKIIIALASLTYILDSDAYDRGFIIIQKYIRIVILMSIYECEFLYVYILSLVFLSLNLYVYCLTLQQKLVLYRGFEEFVAKTHDSWFLMKGAPPRCTFNYIYTF